MAIKAFVDRIILEYPVAVWGKSYCPYTKLTKEALFAVLPRNAVHTEDIDLRPDGEAIQTYLTLLTGKPTVPYVFVDGEFVGGSEETIALLQTGTLPALLADRKAPTEVPVDTPPPGVVT
ncbi:probable Glutaredoxin-C3 [Coccomyxa sp. Obi]|nr:probable Glutaredoxin-C3 [Coccomyxa sp. Obi]